MNLAKIPRGSEVFIDASVLSLYFTKQKPLGAVCRVFLDRCASRELKAYTTDYGLMTNDSLIVAVMQDHKLVHLATNDRDFKRVRGIKIWRPVG